MSEIIPWFERNLEFGKPTEMLPFYLERLEGTVLRIQSKIKDLEDKLLSERFHDKWSIKQHIGHLAEVDEITDKRIGEMVAGISPMSPAVFEPHDYNPWPIEKVISFFTAIRTKNISNYRSLTNADLLKSSLHPRLKVQMTPVDLAWFDAEHDDHHLVKISEIIKNHLR